MALNDVTFVEGQGGLGRPLPGADFISGMVFYGSAPSGFSTNNIQKIFSLAQVEALGIDGSAGDETSAVFSTTLTQGATGDTITFTATLPASTFGGATTSLTIGTYTQASGDTTATLLAASVAAFINSGTATHGFSATSTTGTLKISWPKGYGLTVNNASQMTITKTGAITATTPTVTAATPSVYIHWHYQIAEYFRMQPQGVLYVGVFATPGSYAYTELQTLQNFANGTIRQAAIYKDTTTTATTLAGDTTTIQGICNALDQTHKPLSVLFSANITGQALSGLTDLSGLQNKKVSVVISQDGANAGALLYQQLGKSIPTLGAALGAVSLAAVSQSIAWVQHFNISNGQENATIAFATGDLYSSLAGSLVSTLNAYRYIFLRPFVGLAGSYFNDSHCAITYTSDYAYIENNRTIDKAIRVVYAGVLPYLNGPITLNADGTLANTTIAYIEDQLVNPQLDQMVRDGDLSAYSVTIDPTQNVLSTSTLTVAVKLVSKGVARNIVVNIGYAQSL